MRAKPDLLEDVFPHVGVHSGEGIVEEVEAAVTVDTPGHAHPLLLSSRQIDPLLSDLYHVPARQHLQVGPEGAGLHHPVVQLLVEPLAEGDVALHNITSLFQPIRAQYLEGS